MAMAARLRTGIPILRRVLTTESVSAERSAVTRAMLYPSFTKSEFMRNYASGPPAKEQKVKVPVTMCGASGNYSTALYIASVKANVLDQVESEILALVEASKTSPTFSQFLKDLSVSADTRVKAITEISTQAKFSNVTKNFLSVVAQYGRLKHLEQIARRFSELTMAHRGEVKATVTTVIPLPASEEKELRETLQEILGKGKKVKVEQKIDPSILGGIVVEFSQKVFDMSIRTRAQQMERFLRQPLNLDSP